MKKKKALLWICAALSLLLLCACGQRQAPEKLTAPDSEATDPQVISLVCSDGELTLRFQRDEDGPWLWTDNTAFPLDGACVDSLLEQVAALDSLLPLADAGEPETYDLYDSRKYVSLARSDGSSVTYRFGKASEDGSSYYVNTDDQPERICLAPAGLLKQVGQGIYPMALLPELPALSAETIQDVKLTQNGKSRQFAVHPGRWRSGGEDVTDQPQTRALEALLAKPVLKACVDFAPSDGAAELCGLTDPALVVRVTYADGAYTLTVGNAADSGASRFVCINDDTTIYLMDAAPLEPLLGDSE